ncbi:MAG: sodium:solute symporter family protein [Candidatus Eremiobacteraeota bacterium]|nr:sodium:solute symporter family protein [Candidatus Eremiobacteraeota bacterium]
MSASLIALAIVGLIVFGTIAFALGAVRRFRMDPQEFIVGGRSFGALLLWMLLAGEIYTSFTFLGAAGWAYGKGAPSYYIIVYLPLGYAFGYFFLPAVWRLGKMRGLMTWPDFLIDRYGSNALGASVAVLQFALIIPYVTLQLTGLQILLTIAGYGAYNANVAVAAAFSLITLFVFTAGLRGAAWASVVKDALVLGAAIFAGVYLPVHFFGSPANMITHVLAIKPHWLTLSSGGGLYGMTWFVSTVVLNGLGIFMFPQSAPSIFSAKDEATVRRNTIFMPLYTVVPVFVLLAGFTALLLVPGLQGPAADQSFLLVIQRYFPPWIVGVVCGAGCLAALLPASVLLLGAATVVSRNVLGHTRWVRPTVLLCAALALVLWFFAKTTLVDLLLLVYNGITQLAPGVMLGLLWRRVNAWAVSAGLVAGEAIAISTLHAPTGPWGINAGLIALIVNALVCVAVTLLSPRRWVVAELKSVR